MSYQYILGFQTYASHDSGASIIKFKEGEKPDFIAISEERLSRKKNNYDFPLLSIKYCMDYFNLKKLSQINFIITDWIREKKWLRSGPGYPWSEFDIFKEYINFDKKKIFIIDHHLAHAASTYYTSKFKKSSILIVDGNGSDLETNSYYFGENNKIKLIDKYRSFGIGELYTAISTEILGFGPGGEGKTMGLAPYGNKNKKIKIPYKFSGIETNFSDFMKRLPNSDFHSQYNLGKRYLLFKKIKTANKKNVTKKPYIDWAYEIQNLTEKTMVHFAKDLYKKTKSKNLCMAGGVALNCISNEKIAKKSKIKNLHIFPACSDSGMPFGLALWGYHNLCKQSKRLSFENAYTGKSYDLNEIKNLLDKFNIKHTKYTYSKISKLLNENKIIGIFQGSSEYGPRALGNRSILANPSPVWMRDHINKNIKHRELFRPFAPIVLKQYSKRYFNIEESPFMLRAGPCKKNKIIPAVNHVDQTSRVQTITMQQNKRIYKIISEFKKLTGIPLILNTSFNDNGEPVVESPLDSLISSINTNLDYLIVENFLIDIKNLKNKKKLLKRMLREREVILKKNSLKAKKTLLLKNFFSLNIKKILRQKNKKLLHELKQNKIATFELFFRKIKKDKKYLIVGTMDHTKKVLKLLSISKNRYSNIYYLNFKKNDYPNNKQQKLNNFKNIKHLGNLNWENVLISSHQYQDDIIKFLKNKNILNFINPYKNFHTNILDSY